MRRMSEGLPIHEEALEELGRGAYELAGRDSRTMFVMLLCMAELVHELVKYRAKDEGERKALKRASIELRKEARELALVMFEEELSRSHQNN